MAVEFVKTRETVRFHSPLAGMKEVESVVERRQDPLTGRWASFSEALSGKAEVLFGPTDPDLLQKVSEETRTGCFFCPEKVESVTPRYPTDWIEEGCLKRGECFLFPNLFPVAPVHAVAVLGHQHYRSLDDFPKKLLNDGIGVCLDFIRSVHRAEPACCHFTINSNYLFPAGASLVHPHLQVLGGRSPCTMSSDLSTGSTRYKKEHGADFFTDLVVTEKKTKERYLGPTGPVEWITAYAPIGVNEIVGVTETRNLTDLDVSGLSDGLSRALAAYHHLGFSTFNFTIYAPPIDDPDPSFPVFVRAICRQNVYPNYRADDYFVQKLLGEELVVISPEELASRIRPFWA